MPTRRRSGAWAPTRSRIRRAQAPLGLLRRGAAAAGRAGGVKHWRDERASRRPPADRGRHRLGDLRRDAARGGRRGVDPRRRARAGCALPPASGDEGLPPGRGGPPVDAHPSRGLVGRARRRAPDAHERHGAGHGVAHRDAAGQERDLVRHRAARDRRDGAPPPGRRRAARGHPLPAGAGQRGHAARRRRGARAGRLRRRVLHRLRGRRLADRARQLVHDRHAGGRAARAPLRRRGGPPLPGRARVPRRHGARWRGRRRVRRRGRAGGGRAPRRR